MVLCKQSPLPQANRLIIVSLVAKCVAENSWMEMEVDRSLVLADGIL
jgi:hypothetical protein